MRVHVHVPVAARRDNEPGDVCRPRWLVRDSRPETALIGRVDGTAIPGQGTLSPQVRTAAVSFSTSLASGVPVRRRCRCSGDPYAGECPSCWSVLVPPLRRPAVPVVPAVPVMPGSRTRRDGGWPRPAVPRRAGGARRAGVLIVRRCPSCRRLPHRRRRCPPRRTIRHVPVNQRVSIVPAVPVVPALPSHACRCTVEPKNGINRARGACRACATGAPVPRAAGAGRRTPATVGWPGAERLLPADPALTSGRPPWRGAQHENNPSEKAGSALLPASSRACLNVRGCRAIQSCSRCSTS